jgi:hypothetical protein
VNPPVLTFSKVAGNFHRTSSWREELSSVQSNEELVDLLAGSLEEIAGLVIKARDLPRGQRPPIIDQIATVLDTLGAQIIKAKVAA